LSAFGYQALRNIATGGDNNTAFGYQAGYNITTGSDNLILATATSSTSIANLTTGSQNILIGNNISFPSASANGQLDIGNEIYGTNITGTGSTLSTGNLGIGTTTPGSIFSVQGVANWTGATSTFYGTGGINLAAGCFAIAGTCLSTGASLLGTANSWASLQTFQSGFVSQASSTVVGDFSTTGNVFHTLNSSTTFAVGPNGATNPAFQIFASTTNAATGLQLVSATDREL